jgi:4'-phosphopantetheinyl transferase
MPGASWLARGEPSLPGEDTWLSDLERARAESMEYPKRRNEYLVARWTLKHAVARTLGLPLRDSVLATIEARHAPDGAPELYVAGAPAGRDVSLTDRAGWAVCLVAPGGSNVGVDLELVEPRSPAFVTDYLTEAEQRAVAAAVDAGVPDAVPLLANLLWSAKESALKVLRTGLRRDTRSVEVAGVDPAVPPGRWSPLTVRTEEGETFAGWWRRSGDFLLTTCARATLDLPTSLDEPPALDTATPLHTWLPATSGG